MTLNIHRTPIFRKLALEYASSGECLQEVISTTTFWQGFPAEWTFPVLLQDLRETTVAHGMSCGTHSHDSSHKIRAHRTLKHVGHLALLFWPLNDIFLASRTAQKNFITSDILLGIFVVYQIIPIDRCLPG